MVTRGASDVTSEPARARAAPAGATTRHLALAVIGGALLLGFAVVVVREVLATFDVVAPVADDSYELFAVSLTGLAGGAFAAGIGSGRRRRAAPGRDEDRWRRVIVASFVAGYVIAGGLALLVCLVRLGTSTSVLRGLAAAFLGTSVATLTAFLDLPET